MGEESLLGKFYVYRDEDRDAVAVAQWAKGPSGGMMGQTFCRMGVPYGTTTQEDINDRAEFIVKACNAYNDIAAKDAEIERLKEELACTYEELIDHTGDDMADTRARRVKELRAGGSDAE